MCDQAVFCFLTATEKYIIIIIIIITIIIIIIIITSTYKWFNTLNVKLSDSQIKKTKRRC